MSRGRRRGVGARARAGADAGLWTADGMAARLGLSMIAFPGGHRLGARDIVRVRAAGLTRIEIRLNPSWCDYRDAARLREVSAECRRQGVRVVSVHGPSLRAMWYGDGRARAAALRDTVRTVRIAARLGAGIFVEHCPPREESLPVLQELLARTEGCGVRLAIENGTGADLGAVAGLVADLDSDRVGMNLDIGHARASDMTNPFMRRTGPRKAVRQCRGRIIHVHLHDFSLGDHLPPFYGAIRWRETFAALREIGYAGELMFEVHGRPRVKLKRREAELLRRELRTASTDELREALDFSLWAMLNGAGARPPAGTVESRIRRGLKGMLTPLIKGVMRASTDEVLRCVAAFPLAFERRGGTPGAGTRRDAE